MRARPRKLRSRGLQARIRRATLFLLLPLFGLAAVSGWTLIAGGNASAALAGAQQEETRLYALHEDVLNVSVTNAALLADRAEADLAAAAEAAAQVDGDLSQQRGNSNPEQRTELIGVGQAWQDSRGARDAIRAAVVQKGVTPTTSAVLEEQLSVKVKAVTDRLADLEDLNATEVTSLLQQRDSAQRASGIAVVLALVLGLAGALWLSHRLARSIVEPVSRLRQASERITAGDLSHRVVIGTTDEIAEVSNAFNIMAARLGDREEAVRQEQRRLSALVENSSDGIVVIAEDGGIIFATPLFSTDFTRAGSTAGGLGDVVHPDDSARCRKAWQRVISGGESATSEVEVRLKRGDGQWRHVWMKVTNRLDDPAVAGLVLNISDVSERRDHEEQLTYQALHDALTGLANRELFRQRLERANVAATRGGGAMQTVLYLDFDDFKRVNDKFGHAAGDAFLVEMARRLVASVRPEDTVARLGGDEYAVLMNDTATREGVIAAERVLQALGQSYLVEGKEMAPSASIGVASGVAGATSAETLIADADLAMYFAKRQGKGRFQVFSAAMRTDLLDRLQLGEDLRAAIDSGGLSVNYQPIVDVQTGKIVGAEALARWKHPNLGWVGPATFIPLAEELGLVDQIDHWILREACAQGSAWAAAGQPTLRMAVNLSGRNLDRPDLVSIVAGILDETGFVAGNLDVELTEGVAIAESAGVQETLSKLKELGLHLAIDDFGTGYSALSRLASLPFDTLKVDRSSSTS